MEKIRLLTSSLLLCTILSLALLAFVFCILAEFKKSKVDDVKIDGKLCKLPENEAFWFGMAALICFTNAQIIGNFIIFVRYWSDSKERSSCCLFRRPNVATILLLISWITFGISIILITTATSMNRRQSYGKGWLNGECYIVKDGVFVGASILVLITLGCTLASAIATLRKQYQVLSIEKT
ncbi:uncharacterized protein LOC110719347 [Chenopodium quinoa]|uniref:uncharacterized protein LOC110719347 n=1 Tax=Chenopodium quinoa TaxID=63459 RepID=UPI000B79A02A|nr:uncharacterized protein LOC110719347 [Chenopodium quinoa]